MQRGMMAITGISAHYIYFYSNMRYTVPLVRNVGIC